VKVSYRWNHLIICVSVTVSPMADVSGHGLLFTVWNGWCSWLDINLPLQNIGFLGLQVHTIGWPPAKRSGNHCTGEAGWDLSPILADTENLAPTGVRTLDSVDRSESSYRLRYPCRNWWVHNASSNIRVLLIAFVLLRHRLLSALVSEFLSRIFSVFGSWLNTKVLGVWRTCSLRRMGL
jgi:hypothetical protein